MLLITTVGTTGSHASGDCVRPAFAGSGQGRRNPSALRQWEFNVNHLRSKWKKKYQKEILQLVIISDDSRGDLQEVRNACDFK